MSKIVSNNKEKLKKGLDVVADAVKITIGPRGKNVAIENGLHPIIANDGGRIAKEIVLKDPIENIGAAVVKDVVQRTSDNVGGGRTASAIITQAVVNEGFKLIEKGFNANLLKKGMNRAVKDITEQLDSMARKADKKAVEQVATISTESEELGKVIADTMNKVGVDGIVTVEESNSFGIVSEVEDGLKCNQGYVSPYMVTNPERMEAEYEDIQVLIADKKISSFKDILPVVERIAKQGKKDLFIISENFEGEALNVCVINKLQGRFNTLAIKTPGVGDNKKFVLEDLAALTGAEVLTDHNKAETIKLGIARKVVATKDSTIILGGGDIKTWITTLKTRRELCENKWEIDQYNERIAKLQNGIAVIKVGASSDTEVKYLKLKIEDGVNEAKRAMEEGIVVGGNCAFLHAVKHLDAEGKDEEALGYQIVLKAVEAPLRQIILNGNGSPDVVIEKIRGYQLLTSGYDALENKVIEDMYKAGIVDAVKVSKTVLQNAVSAAGMFLSVECSITNEVKEDE